MLEPSVFLNRAEEMKEELLEKLMHILSIPSIYDPNTADNNAPFGKGIREALDYMLNIGKEEGFRVKNVGGYAGHIEWGEGEELVGILGHVDVVPPGSGWSHDPFRPYLKDEKLFARGVQDDKGPVLAAFFAMKMLKEMGIDPGKRIRLILGTDEERSWKCMDHYFKHEEMPDYGFSPDAEFPVIHAEKGLIDLAFHIPVPENEGNGNVQLLQLSGGDRLNMVPASAQAVLQTSKQDSVKRLFETYVTDRKIDGNIELLNSMEMKVICYGKTAHGSIPEQGKNAIMFLLEFLTGLDLSHPLKEKLKKIIGYFRSTSGKGLQIHSRDDVSGSLTLNTGTLRWEQKHMNIGVNIRYPVTIPIENWYPQILSVAELEGWSVNTIDHMEPLYVPQDDLLVKILLNTYENHTGQKAKPISIGGATYARVLKKGVAYGAMFPDRPDTAHQADEHMIIDDLVRSTAIYADALLQIIRHKI